MLNISHATYWEMSPWADERYTLSNNYFHAICTLFPWWHIREKWKCAKSIIANESRYKNMVTTFKVDKLQQRVWVMWHSSRNKTFRPPQSRITTGHNIMTGDCNIDPPLPITLICNIRTSLSVKMAPIVMFWLVVIIMLLWHGGHFIWGQKFYYTGRQHSKLSKMTANKGS